MASVDIDALSAREIKERLTAARVDFSDCFEKRELVKRLRDHCRALDDDKVQEVKALANRCCGASYFPGYARGAACVSWRGVCSTPTLKQARAPLVRPSNSSLSETARAAC